MYNKRWKEKKKKPEEGRMDARKHAWKEREQAITEKQL